MVVFINSEEEGHCTSAFTFLLFFCLLHSPTPLSPSIALTSSISLPTSFSCPASLDTNSMSNGERDAGDTNLVSLCMLVVLVPMEQVPPALASQSLGCIFPLTAAILDSVKVLHMTVPSFIASSLNRNSRHLTLCLCGDCN